MKYNSIIFFWILANIVSGQNTPSWVVQSAVKNSTVELTWYPTDAEVWKEGLRSGYTITRESMSGGGSKFTPMQTSIKDSVWFKANVSPEDGVIYPIGVMLNRDNFINKDNKQNDELQYNYIVFESKWNIKVAEATGLGIVDKTIQVGTTYKYTVKHNKTGQTTSITVKCDEGTQLQEPKDYQHEFKWPDGNSLSDMLEQSQALVIKAIIGKARPKIDSVILRWVPTSIEICRDAMVDGYEIWRGKGGDTMKMLTAVKPWTEAQMRQMPRSDTFALLAAAFVMDNGIPQGIEQANMLDRATMESNYFGISLMAADKSQLAADVLGLRYVDKEVEFGETYHYEIKTKRLQPNIPMQDFWVTNEYEPLTAPQNFRSEKNEKSVRLKWLPHGEVLYSSFIIERLNPGDSVYQPITKEPIVFIRANELKNNQLSYIDSLPSNNVSYMYRIKGSNAFGEWSDYAYINAYGVDRTPPNAVSIISGKFNIADTTIRISWRSNSIDNDLKHNQVMIADNPDYNFSAISGELSPNDTVFILSLRGMEVDRPYYFQVNSVDSSLNVTRSVSRFVFTPDEERPLAPPNIKATISDSGMVTVSWRPSASKDVVGYYVFASNNDPQKLALVFDKPLKDTTYSYQIDMNSITKYLYVGLKSEDDNYNRSFLSEILQLRRPDTIAPMSPLLTTVELKDEKIVIKWNKSASADVEKYMLFSRNPEDSTIKWVLLDSISKEIDTYTTTSELFEGKLMYSVKAVDDFGNQSSYSNSGEVFLPFPSHKYIPKLNIPVINKNNSVELSWQKQPLDIKGKNIPYKYLLYRSVGSQNVMMYKEVSSNSFSFKDDSVRSGVLYNYAISVKYDNGWTGDLSETKSILIR